MQDHLARSARRVWKRTLPSILVLLSFPALHAEQPCSVEIKLLLSPPTIDSVVASLDFKKQAITQIYFLDTGDLSLLNQGVIVRVRQGAKNDLTVKVRVPDGNNHIEVDKLRDHYECEIDRTESGANTSYSVGQSYKDRQVPRTGDILSRALSSQQRKLLTDAHVSVPWSQVRVISSIRSTTWATPLKSSSGKLTLEYWDLPGSSLLELSARSAASGWELKSADLHGIVKSKGLSLSANQETKTNTVLRGLKPNALPP
jgi:hypothetical protein